MTIAHVAPAGTEQVEGNSSVHAKIYIRDCKINLRHTIFIIYLLHYKKNLVGTKVFYEPDGQVSVLQSLVSISSPLHATPPFCAGVSIVLVRDCEPVPQVAEHSVHSPNSPHTQSTE